MYKIIVTVALIAVAFHFAEGQTAPKPKFLPIVFDDWWNVDFVKNGCQLASQNSMPCPSDRTPKEVVSEFEDELDVAFATESSCHGLSLSHFTPEMAEAAVKNPNAPATGAAAKMAGPAWSLMLDLDAHSRTQKGRGWTLVGPNKQTFSGRITTHQQLIQRICKIAKGVGGKTEN